MERYQLRFQLASLRPDGSELTTWKDWLQLPNPLMLYLTESLDEFMRTEGTTAALGCLSSRLPSSGRSAGRACLEIVRPWNQ